MADKRKPTSKPDDARRSFVQQLAAQIPWFHHCVLLDCLTHPSQHEWYIHRNRARAGDISAHSNTCVPLRQRGPTVQLRKSLLHRADNHQAR